MQAFKKMSGLHLLLSILDVTNPAGDSSATTLVLMEFLARDICKRRLVTMLRCLENQWLGHAARVAAATVAYLEDAKRGDIPCQERLRLLKQMEEVTCLMWLGAHSAAEVVLRRLHVAPPWAAMGRRLAQARHMTDQQQRAADLGTLDALP
jgi:hypothetical protein